MSTIQKNIKRMEETVDGIHLTKVHAGHEIDNDGIGHYEYWGQKCYDAGHDYVRGWVCYPYEFSSKEEFQTWLKRDPDTEGELFAIAKDLGLVYGVDDSIELIEISYDEREKEIVVEYSAVPEGEDDYYYDDDHDRDRYDD